MLLAEDHEVVDAFVADRANRPLGKAVLAGAAAEIGLSWIPIVFIRRLTMVGYPSSMPSLQNHRYAKLTCTSVHSRRSERIANTRPTISIRIISTGSIEGRPMYQ